MRAGGTSSRVRALALPVRATKALRRLAPATACIHMPSYLLQATPPKPKFQMIRCICNVACIYKAGPDGGQPRDRWCACDPTPMLRGLLGAVSWLPILGTTSDTGHTAGEALCGMVTNTYAQADESRTAFAVGPTPTLPNLLCKCGSIASCDQLEKPDIAGKRHQAAAQRRVYEINASSRCNRQHLIEPTT